MKKLWWIIPFFIFSIGFAQNPKGFDKMAKKMADSRVATILPSQVKKLQEKGEDVVLLDARELTEYNVSHIKNAYFVGYNNFKKKQVAHLAKNKVYVVYCSVGYRSGKIAYKLNKLGFNKVFNLYGGIFNWVNNGYPVYTNKLKTTTVHPYNNKWGKWLKPAHKSKL